MLVFKNEIITHEFIYGARKDLIDLHWTELLYTWGLPPPPPPEINKDRSRLLSAIAGCIADSEGGGFLAMTDI